MHSTDIASIPHPPRIHTDLLHETGMLAATPSSRSRSGFENPCSATPQRPSLLRPWLSERIRGTTLTSSGRKHRPKVGFLLQERLGSATDALRSLRQENLACRESSPKGHKRLAFQQQTCALLKAAGESQVCQGKSENARRMRAGTLFWGGDHISEGEGHLSAIGHYPPKPQKRWGVAWHEWNCQWNCHGGVFPSLCFKPHNCTCKLSSYTLGT